MKQRGYLRPTSGFAPILLPRNTGTGVVLAALAFVFGFAMVWYMWWLAAASFISLVAYAIHHTFNYDREFHLAGERCGSLRRRANATAGGELRQDMSYSLTAGEAAVPPVFHQVNEHDHAAGGSTMLGFWIYLMSDCLIFAVLFASYGVLGAHQAGGPGPRDLFDLPLVAVNTSMLLLSSITYGFAMLWARQRRVGATQLWLAITALLRRCFHRHRAL